MSPELGFALLLTLLWGPTALWLLSRALRGQRRRLDGSFVSDSEAMQSSGLAYEPEALASQGFWICSACRSVNRREAKSCYSCRQAMQQGVHQAPETMPVHTTMVPVMAEGLARPAAETVRTTVALVAPATADPVPVPLVRDPGRATAVPPLEVLPADSVCPFLGFSDDPTTRCSFPDPRNRCHTPSEPGSDLVALPRRLITGKAGTMRTLEIGAEHQETLCLTATHEQCARFPAVRMVAASR